MRKLVLLLGFVAWIPLDAQATEIARGMLLSIRHEVDFEYRPEVLILNSTEFTPATLSLDGYVLKFEDMTVGTTAITSTRRFRYDGRGERLRLIGLDATV